MRLQHLVRRLSAAQPEVLIVDSLPVGRIVHAVYDQADEQRREVFVMNGGTWSRIEIDASLITPYVAQWRVRRARDVGTLSHGDTLLTLPLPTPVTSAVIEPGLPAIVPRREWRIQL